MKSSLRSSQVDRSSRDFVTQQVIHLVPELPPCISGVGDYAMEVGRQLEENVGASCAYIAAGHRKVALPADGPCVRNITARCEPSALWRAIEELADMPTGDGYPETRPAPLVVVNYSGYGYNPNGTPSWLAEALRGRPTGLDARIVTFFHELYAVGWPWQRAFWYSTQQRRIAGEIARLSDAIVTNREQSARWLEKAIGQPTGSIRSLSTPSNVGEPLVPVAPRERGVGVCFGSAQFKRDFLERFASATAEICAAVGIREIISIGQNTSVRAGDFARCGITVKQLGILPRAEVSEWLGRAKLSFITYYPDCLSKSSCIAAFAAYGIPMIMGDSCDRDADGLVAGRHYLRLSEAQRLTPTPSKLTARLEESAEQLFDWYQPHCTLAHAKALLSELAGNSRENGRQPATCSQRI
jgi:hypothetical protein